MTAPQQMSAMAWPMVARLFRYDGRLRMIFPRVAGMEMPRCCLSEKPGLSMGCTGAANACSKNVGKLRVWFVPATTATI